MLTDTHHIYKRTYVHNSADRCTHTPHTIYRNDKRYHSARMPLLNMPFPAIVLFNSSQNTKILSHFMNNYISADMSSKMFIDFELDFEVRDVGEGLYALVASIDTVALMRGSLEELHSPGVESELVGRLDAHDQGTGVAFAALLPVLWAIRVNRFLSPSSYGEAIAVVGGVVRNFVTEHIAVKAATHIDRVLHATAPTQLLFLAGHDNLDTMEMAYGLFGDGALQYVHTGACDEAAGGGVDGVCKQPYPALLISAYTSYKVSNIQTPLSASETALLDRELWMRGVFGMRAQTGVVAEYACPAHTRATSIHTHAGMYQRYCSVCTSGTFYKRTARVCVACENNETCSATTSLVPHACSFSRDNLCVDCARDAHACLAAVL